MIGLLAWSLHQKPCRGNILGLQVEKVTKLVRGTVAGFAAAMLKSHTLADMAADKSRTKTDRAQPSFPYCLQQLPAAASRSSDASRLHKVYILA